MVSLLESDPYRLSLRLRASLFFGRMTRWQTISANN